MGIAPIAYNFFTAKRALLRKRAGQGTESKEGGEAGRAYQEARGFTVTIPCGVGPAYVANDHNDVAYLSINSISSSYVIHVKRVLSQG